MPRFVGTLAKYSRLRGAHLGGSEQNLRLSPGDLYASFECGLLTAPRGVRIRRMSADIEQQQLLRANPASRDTANKGRNRVKIAIKYCAR